MRVQRTAIITPRHAAVVLVALFLQLHFPMRDALPAVVILPLLALEVYLLLCVPHCDEAPYDDEEEGDSPA